MSAPEAIETSGVEPLDLAEKNTLAYNESIISKGMEAFVAVGNALARIREDRLYRQTHATFESYCRERWGLSKRHCNRLIESAEVVESVGPIGPEITTESQARELAKVPPERRAEVVEKATTATGGKITAKAIQKAAADEVIEAEVIEPKKSRPETKNFDALGIEIEFRQLAQRWAKKTTESRHDDLRDAAAKGIADGIRMGAEFRKEAAK